MAKPLIRRQRSPKKNLRAKQRNQECRIQNIASNPVSWRDRGITADLRVKELDRKHGTGKGAVKERAKLAMQGV